MSDYWFLCLAALFAGLIDAIGGGGGLIQLPALFAAMPGSPPASLFGTNKLAAICGTGIAAWRLGRKTRIEWGAALPAALAAFLFAFLGAVAVTRVSPDFLRKLLPVLLAMVAIYTFCNKSFGVQHKPRFQGRQERVAAVILGAGVGFYDGFFGPGTGSFLMFLFIGFFGFGFLGASVAAKVVNVACNLAALAWFGWAGHVIWQVGLAMAVCNVVGAWFGSRLALRHGVGLIRGVFLVAVLVLIAKTGYDAYFA